jgi:hypothetical protein
METGAGIIPRFGLLSCAKVEDEKHETKNRDRRIFRSIICLKENNIISVKLIDLEIMLQHGVKKSLVHLSITQ